MAHVSCRLSHSLHIVVEPVRLRRAAEEYPDAIPPTRNTVREDLMRLSDFGVPTLIGEGRDGEPRITFCTPRYEIVCGLTNMQDGYYAYRISPLSLRNHDRISRHTVAVIPRDWRLHYHVRELATSLAGIRLTPRSGFDQISAAWAEARRIGRRPHAQPPGLSQAHLSFLSNVETLIDLAREVELDKQVDQGYAPVIGVEPVAHLRMAGDVYRFRLAADTSAKVGDYVWAGVGGADERGPGYVGVVAEKVNGTSVVRFHRPVDLARLRRVEWLLPWVSTKQYDIQKAAVRALREGQSLNPHILSVVVDARFKSYDAPVIQQGKGRLNPAQRTVMDRAQCVPDVLLVLGPPGTGKTHTIRSIVNQQAADGKKVLITSKNNKAVDNVLEALKGVDALRIGREEAVSAQVRRLMIDNRAREKQQEILAKVTPMLESLNTIEALWPEVQRIVDPLVRRAADWRLAETRFQQARETLAEWQRARYDDAVQDIEAQIRRFSVAHQQAHQAARRAASLARRIDMLSELCQLPGVGSFFERWRGRLQVRWQQSAEAYWRGLEERMHASSRVRDYWNAYRYTASSSDEALRRKRVVADSETELTRVRDMAAEAVARLETITANLEDAPALQGVAESPRSLEATRQRFHQWHEALHHRRNLLHDWHELLQTRRQALYPTLIQMADVVGATCIGIATDARFEDLEFDLMIADEAGQIQVMDLLVPLVRARRAVLVGDHRQLPPIVERDITERVDAEDRELRAWLDRSLFEELFDRETTPDTHTVRLNIQYRMPGPIADFISQHFYEGHYETGREVAHTDPFFDSPMVFVDTIKEHRRRESPAIEPEGIRGYTNDLEAALIADLVLAYRRRGIQWGVIVPYKKQAERIRQVLRERHPAFPVDDLKDWVATVDSFQGKERDAIIYGFTRSNPRGRVGFLVELRRLNVSLTRARHQLVIFGDSKTLARAADAGFAQLIQALLITVRAARGGYLYAHDYRQLLDR